MILILNHAPLNWESGPDISHPGSSPHTYSESHPAADEKDASLTRGGSTWDHLLHPSPPHSLKKDFTLHSVHCSPQLKGATNKNSALDL